MTLVWDIGAILVPVSRWTGDFSVPLEPLDSTVSFPPWEEGALRQLHGDCSQVRSE